MQSLVVHIFCISKLNLIKDHYEILFQNWSFPEIIIIHMTIIYLILNFSGELCEFIVRGYY